MDDNLNYETYIFVSSKKVIISVNTDLVNEIYQAELVFEDTPQEINFEKLDYFLNENIFKIEKKLKNFIKKVSLIIDLDVFFPIEISVKNNYEDIVNFRALHHLLYEAKDFCKKTLAEKKIVHMLITNYLVDNKSYSFLPNNIRCNSFSLDIKFICASNNLIKNLEKILKKYQISLSQVVSASYVKNFLSNEEKNIFLMSKKIINGHNPNEVILVGKNSKKQGFFEKFFNFFN